MCNRHMGVRVAPALYVFLPSSPAYRVSRLCTQTGAMVPLPPSHLPRFFSPDLYICPEPSLLLLLCDHVHHAGVYTLSIRKHQEQMACKSWQVAEA